MDFAIIGPPRDVEVIAVGGKIRELVRLRRLYGPGRWRKLKGTATIRLDNGDLLEAEVHWYGAHRVGKKEFKIKRIF